MNIYEYIKKILEDFENYVGEDFSEQFSKVSQIELTDSMYNVKLLEALCLFFGSITGSMIYEMGYPYEYEDTDKDKVYRAFFREMQAGRMVKEKLSLADNGARSIYGLTEKGYKDIVSYLNKRNSIPALKLRKISFHEYALGCSLMKMIKNGMDFTVEFEVVHEAFKPYGQPDKKNVYGSLRTDAKITYRDEIIYIEQDMGTESIEKLAGKLKYYAASSADGKIVFSFHKALNATSVKNSDIDRLLAVFKQYDSIEKLMMDVEEQTVMLPSRAKELLQILNVLSPVKSFDAYRMFLAHGKEKIAAMERALKLYQFSQNRMKHVYEHILSNEELLAIAKGGMRVYCTPSELLYASGVFKNQSRDIFFSLLGEENILFIGKEGIFAHGIFFNSFAKVKPRGKCFLEYPQEDVCSLVRCIQAFKSVINSNDFLIMAYYTESFGKYLADLIIGKKGHVKGNRKTISSSILFYEIGSEKICTYQNGAFFKVGDVKELIYEKTD